LTLGTGSTCYRPFATLGDTDPAPVEESPGVVPMRGEALQGGHMASSRLGYRPELDGIRGIAILLVVLLHLQNWPPGGFVGVDVFFTLSGFLITTLLLEEWNSRGTFSLRQFYTRRALRLLPAVTALLLAYGAVALAFRGPNLGTRLTGVAYAAAYLSNWPQALGRPFPEQEIGFLWTLAIEEQYYLLWPGLLLLVLVVGRLPSRRLIALVLCLVLAIWVWRLHLATGVEGRRIYFGTDTRLDQLLLGAALAAWFVARPASPRSAWALRLGGWAGIAFLSWRVFDPIYFRSWYPSFGIAAIGVASAAMLASVITSSSATLTWILRRRSLRWLGMLSYSLYLWHVPSIRAVDHSFLGDWPLTRFVAGLLLSVLVAAGSYKFVEKPFLRKRSRHEQLHSTKAEAEAIASPGRPGHASGPSWRRRLFLKNEV
jgi:peptidoglycan/LPS O-acetylase OafA/YrhL